jgi:hypothetical protein
MSEQYSHADFLAFVEFQKAKNALELNKTPSSPSASSLPIIMSSTPKAPLSNSQNSGAKTSTTSSQKPRGRRSKENAPESSTQSYNT